MGFAAAAKVGVKHQTFFIVVLKQNDTLVRLGVFINGGDDHRRWISELRIAGLTQPAFK